MDILVAITFLTLPIRLHTTYNSIQLQFSDGQDSIQTSVRGGLGGQPDTFQVPAGQFITFIYVCYGWAAEINANTILQFQFITNLGVSSSTYGTTSDGTCSYIDFLEPLIGISGYADSYYINGLIIVVALINHMRQLIAFVNIFL